MKKFTLENLKKIYSMGKRYSFWELYYKIREKLASPWQDYNQHIGEYLPSPVQLREQTMAWREFPHTPLVSIVVPLYETPEVFLRQMIDSCLEQSYGKWELCLADGSRNAEIGELVERIYGDEPRIRYQRLEKNGGIAENTNQGFAMAEGEYIALLDHDDLLVPSALYEMVNAMNQTGAEVLYSDEDKVTGDPLIYLDPHFKLDFNREFLLSNNYICHFLMVSRRVWEQAGGMKRGYDGAQDFDFVLRCSKATNQVCHVPKILYHWRVHESSTAGNVESKGYAYEAGKKIVEEWVRDQGWQGSTEILPDLGFYRTRYDVPKGCRIGIYLWGGSSARIKKWLESRLSLLSRQIIWERERLSEADYVLLVRGDVKKIKEESVEILLGSCGRSGVGMVGARTVKNGKVVQCGYWKKENGYEARFLGLNSHFKGYFRRGNLPVEVDALCRELVVLDGAVWKLLQDTELLKNGEWNRESEERWLQFCTLAGEKGYRMIVDPMGEACL